MLVDMGTRGSGTMERMGMEDTRREGDEVDIVGTDQSFGIGKAHDSFTGACIDFPRLWESSTPRLWLNQRS